jgi:transcriptional regulator with XRE-family HTH domain
VNSRRRLRCGFYGGSLSPEVLYTAPVNRERYRRETLRLAGILRDELREKGVSIRSLEQKMGVGSSVYQKALKGRVTMTLDTLLQIADALDLEWPEFFRKAYPEISKEPVATAAMPDELEGKILDVLRRHGVLPGASMSGD